MGGFGVTWVDYSVSDFQKGLAAPALNSDLNHASKQKKGEGNTAPVGFMDHGLDVINEIDAQSVGKHAPGHIHRFRHSQSTVPNWLKRPIALQAE